MKRRAIMISTTMVRIRLPEEREGLARKVSLRTTVRYAIL
jgi:hypothetical protein